tara:strand:+ start:3016 stop:3216 length:201 start_codon:yes stop_codon:yes gene_type:complete
MNVGFQDRVVRGVGGIIIVIIDFVASGDFEVAFLALGAWSVLTSTFGWCPFYRVGGINTCPLQHSK